MKKTLSVITLAFLLTVSFCACSEPAITISYETPMPTVVLVSSTDTPAVTSEPTASPTPAPLTIEEIELSLEALTGEELEYDADDYIALDTEKYMFTGSSGNYYVYSDTGEVYSYASTIEMQSSDTVMTEEELLSVSLELINKYCPEFLEYEYYYETVIKNETKYCFYIYQLSENGLRTGNNININIANNGIVDAFFFHVEEDPLTVDGEYSVKEDEAVDITYTAANDILAELFSEDGYTYETDADIMENHIVESYITCHKKRIMWHVEIQNVYVKTISSEGKIFEYSFSFTVSVDADTGEVCASSYSISDIENYTD